MDLGLWEHYVFLHALETDEKEPSFNDVLEEETANRAFFFLSDFIQRCWDALSFL